jgi:dihydroorotate dehydrogenase
VLDYLAVGASAVQVGTASFTDPRASQRLLDDLESTLSVAKTFTVNELSDNFLRENG